jgi:hypothetical protein
MIYLCSAFEKQRNYKDDSVAQQVEHIPFKDGVLGSSPSWVTFIRQWSLYNIAYTATFFCSQGKFPFWNIDPQGCRLDLKKK